MSDFIDFENEFPFPAQAASFEGAQGIEGGGAPHEVTVLSVSQLGRALRSAVDVAFPRAVLVRGEVQNAKPASSGHMYFTLKDEDEDAIADVVVYKTNLTPRMRELVKDGARVRVRARPTFWVPRGRLQLVGDRVEDQGRGALLEALEKLTEKLRAEGLFAPERKRAIPADPRVIGVVTSATGAVIHDIARVASRRGGAHLLLMSAQVQGQGAGERLARALKLVSRVRGVDVVILGRGGGSRDDLLAFSDEVLVRAVATCRVPVIAAVGHDEDVPLVDFAADARAATPSQAAEMVVPDRAGRRRLADKQSEHLKRAMLAFVARRRASVQSVAYKLSDPRLAIASWQQKKDELDARLSRVSTELTRTRSKSTHALSRRLALVHPRAVLLQRRAELVRLNAQIESLIVSKVDRARSNAARTIASLDALSPLAVLGRGYAIALKGKSPVRSPTDVKKGDIIEVRVAGGRIDAKVTGTHEDE